MALPTTFANLVNPTGPELDADLSAVGAIGVFPCTVSGSANAIIMTPNANVPVPASNPNAPTVAALGNYMRFTGIAGATNNGPVQIQIGVLPALNAYKDTPAGPVALVGAEIVLACPFDAIYDSTLNANAGGFHISTAALPNASPINPSQFQVASGSTLTRLLSTSTVVPYTVLPAASGQDATVALAGVLVGDAVMLGLPATVTAGLL